MKKLSGHVASVTNQEQLARFIGQLASESSVFDNDWKNKDLASFLYAMSAWVEDMDAYYKNSGLPYSESSISWKNIADMLYAATMYE